MRIYHLLVLLYALVSVLALAAIPLSATGWQTYRLASLTSAFDPKPTLRVQSRIAERATF